MRIEPEISGVAIVLRGSFNPSIFQPLWFARHELITDDAAASANIHVVHPEVTSFEIDPEFTFNVDRDRLVVSRAIAPLVTASDLLCRIFGDLLPHTPISMLGINRQVHFNVGSFEERNRIGYKLAPLEPWGEWGKKLPSEEPDKNGGLASLSLIKRNVDDREAGWIRVVVQPSERIGRNRTGLFMEVNDHYQLPDPDKAADATSMIRILQERFDQSLKNSDSIVDQVMSLKNGQT